MKLPKHSLLKGRKAPMPKHPAPPRFPKYVKRSVFKRHKTALVRPFFIKGPMSFWENKTKYIVAFERSRNLKPTVSLT